MEQQDLPEPSPEGVLIRRVRESLRPRLPVAEAAKRAGVGEATWGNTERGYRKPGRLLDPLPFRPSAKILAHMAHAIGLTPEDLHEVGRADAAAVLAEMRGPDVESPSTTLPAAVRRIRAVAQSEGKTVGEVLLEHGLPADELAVPDSLPQDRMIADIEAEDIPRETKDRLIRIYLERRAEMFEDERRKRQKPGK